MKAGDKEDIEYFKVGNAAIRLSTNSYHLMQHINNISDKKICKIHGRFKCIRGLPWLTKELGSSVNPQISKSTSSDGYSPSGT